MNNPTLNQFLAILEELCLTLTKAVRYAAGAVASMSWPALLASCIVLALAISVVPLALTLFIVFMLAKLLIAAFVMRPRRDPPPPREPLNGEGK